MKNRYRIVKAAIIAVCVLAAGICYSCSMQEDKWSSDSLSATTEKEHDKKASAKKTSPQTDSLTPFAQQPKEEVSGEPFSQPPAANEPDGAPTVSAAVPPQEPASKAEVKVSVCYVHICGEINSPGVYEMEEGSRIFQVVECAGGFTENAASQYLNMAQIVCDGMKIVVPDQRTLKSGDQFGLNGEGQGGNANSCIIVPKGAGTQMGSSGSTGGNTSTPKVNLNTASKEELMTLKGVGEAKADDIIAYRDSHGGFHKIEDIMKISGIKSSAFEKIKNDITV